MGWLFVLFFTSIALPTATLTVEPQSPVFTGETVTLKCVIEPKRVWKYKWYKDRNSNLLSQSDTSTHTITVAQSDKGPYWCQGEMRQACIITDEWKGLSSC